MSAVRPILNHTVAALIAVTAAFGLARAEAGDATKLDTLYAQLAEADPGAAPRIVRDIQIEQGKSGSASMNLLLKRGRDATQAGDTEAAVEHLTALTDHAPGFAEGWHARAIAYARMGLYGPALADIERTLALNPRHFDALASLGALLQEVGYDTLAVEAYDAALALHPHFTDVIAARDRLLIASGGSDI